MSDSYPAHGRVIIATQDALCRGEFRSEQERDEFCQFLAKTARENMRQRLLTWRANSLTGSDLAESQARDRARRNAA